MAFITIDLVQSLLLATLCPHHGCRESSEVGTLFANSSYRTTPNGQPTLSYLSHLSHHDSLVGGVR